MSIIAIIQARTSSTRFPNKVLKEVLGKPLLLHMWERVKRSQQLSEVVVATSTDSSDDKLSHLCLVNHIPCVRGSLEDVLHRFYMVIQEYSKVEHIVRLTGDCPLIDPHIIDDVILYHLQTGADYTSNCFEYTLPDGMDVEIFKRDSLIKSVFNAKLISEREHVTQYIRKHPEMFDLKSWKHNPPYQGRLTVDYPEDFDIVKTIFEALYPILPEFNLSDIKRYLTDHPELKDLNKSFIPNEGLTTSMINDKECVIGDDGQISKIH